MVPEQVFAFDESGDVSGNHLFPGGVVLLDFPEHHVGEIRKVLLIEVWDVQDELVFKQMPVKIAQAIPSRACCR
jgi:hypothetical protein